MKIPRLAPAAGRTPSLWPTDKEGVLRVAQEWYAPDRVALNDDALTALVLPPIAVGAEASMAAGRMKMDLRDTLGLSIALNSINYQFWEQREGGVFYRYDFEGVVGALGMRTAFERAWSDPESPIARARDTGHVLTVSDIAAVFGDIPEPQSRSDVLNEVFRQLPEAVNHLNDRIAETGRIDTPLAHDLAERFPLAYGDPVLKKAQLAVSEVWVNTCSRGLPVTCDLTAFADYQIPNILRAMGVLAYAPDLADAIDRRVPLAYGSPDECAIRAACLLAVERIAEQTGSPVAAVDHYLWTRRKEATTPFHLTVTTAY